MSESLSLQAIRTANAVRESVRNYESKTTTLASFAMSYAVRFVAFSYLVHYFIIAGVTARHFQSQTLIVHHSQDPSLPGTATPRVCHSQGEPLYSISEHFINPTSVSANHYYF